MLVVLNFVLSYGAWLAVATLAARGDFLWAVVPSLIAVAGHLLLMPPERRRPDFLLCLAAIPLGVAVEGWNMATGATRYAAGAEVAGGPPLFMIGLWMAFATLPNVSLSWLKQRPAVAVLFGAIAAAPSYYAGAKIGALTMGEPIWQSLVLIGAAWAMALPALLYLARRIG